MRNKMVGRDQNLPLTGCRIILYDIPSSIKGLRRLKSYITGPALWKIPALKKSDPESITKDFPDFVWNPLPNRLRRKKRPTR
jgi:hypothetical protein